MKAMILAAGRGERMRPLTDKTPKPLLKVSDKSLIEHHIENLVAIGVTDIVINTAWLSEQFPLALGNGEKYGCHLHFSQEEPGALETAGGIQKALSLLKCDEFIVVNGDVWCDYDLNKLNKGLAKGKLAHLILTHNPAHHPSGDFAISNDGELRNNSADSKENCWTYTGIGLYHAKLFESVAQYPAPLGPLLKTAIAQAQISGELHQGEWFDIGTPERLNQLREQLSKLA